QAVRAQCAEEFLLAAVAGVQRADAHAGVLGHRGDRRAGVGHEHRPGRFEDAPVVAGRLGLAAAERAVAVRSSRLGPDPPPGLGHEERVTEDWNKVFRSDSVGTEDFVPLAIREDPMSAVTKAAATTEALSRAGAGRGARAGADQHGRRWRLLAFAVVIAAAVM